VAGLVTPLAGEILIGGASVVSDGVERIGAEKRRVGLVFQEYALFPNMTVAANIGFALPKKERDVRVQKMLERVDLEAFGSRLPAQLSGGQQQRVALARALAGRPQLMLLDEPFANVDASLHARLGDELVQTLRQEGAACLLVTHDSADALMLADRVAVVVDEGEGGRVVQVASPQELYQRPSTQAVARLTGPAWFLEGQADGDSVMTAIGVLRLMSPRQGQVTLVIRPEQLVFQPQADGEHNVVSWQYMGRGYRAVCEVDGGVLVGVDCRDSTGSQKGTVTASCPVWAL